MAIDINTINTEMTTPPLDTGESQRLAHPAPHPEPAPAVPSPQRSYTVIWLALTVLLLLLIVGIAMGIVSRSVAEHRLEQTTARDAVLSINVIHPTVTGSTGEIALPGNTQAFNDTPIYARTNGYLKNFFVDIGQHVRKGELMAVIQTPEIDEQLQVARANLKSAQADLNLANTTSERYQHLLSEDSVSRQETDVAVSGAAARKAAVEAAEANVRRLQELQSFERVYAPFDGVVTARNTDIGALIDAGSGSAQPRDLFRIAAIHRLRVFVPVPEIYAPAIANGETASLTLDEYPGQAFTGTVARNSSAIDPNSRTLNVEVDVNNIGGKLLPGAYIFVHFKLPQARQMLSVPSNTLLFRAEGLRVGVVHSGRVHLQPVTIGRDNGSTLEIATGLTASDHVILNPADSLAEGQQVRVANTAPSTAGAQ